MNLLLIIDDQKFADSYIEVALAVAEKGAMLWYRCKAQDARLIVEKARKLRKALPYSKLILSDRADIAALCGFDGVHLNSRSLPASAIKQMHPNLIIGYSAHSPTECNDEFCDYFTLSPIFETQKDYAIKPLGGIKSPATNVYALGGLKLNDYDKFIKLGYKGIAGISLCSEIILSQKLPPYLTRAKS